MKTKLYLAAPLFNPAEREYCVLLKSVLSDRFDVYVPHQDGSLLPDLSRSGVPYHAARSLIFESDINAIREAALLLVVLNGRTVDEGAAFELGVGWALGKSCFGIKEDFRQLTSDGDNPMIEVALKGVFRSVGELQAWARTGKW